MFRALLHSFDVSSDGAWSILALDGILLIPLIFAVFFYPVAVLEGIGAVVVLTVAIVVVLRAVHTHHHRHGMT